MDRAVLWISRPANSDRDDREKVDFEYDEERIWRFVALLAHNRGDRFPEAETDIQP